MNITSSACLPWNAASDTGLPETTSGRANAGAFVPSSSMVEAVAAIVCGSSVTVSKAVTHTSIRRTGLRLNSGALPAGPYRNRPFVLLYRDTPDQEPIREGNRTDQEQNRAPVQQDQLHLMVRDFPPGTASAGVTIPFFVVRDSPAFATLLRHQPDYARSLSGEPSPITEKVIVLARSLVYRFKAGRASH